MTCGEVTPLQSCVSHLTNYCMYCLYIVCFCPSADCSFRFMLRIGAEDFNFIKPSSAECCSGQVWRGLLRRGHIETWSDQRWNAARGGCVVFAHARHIQAHWCCCTLETKSKHEDKQSKMASACNTLPEQQNTHRCFTRQLFRCALWAGCLRRLRQLSKVLVENVSAQKGAGAGFFLDGDADISVRNSGFSTHI